MTQIRNCYDAALRFIQLSNEIEEVAKQLSHAKDRNTRDILEKKMDVLDIEFIKVKHNLQASSYIQNIS